MREIVLGAVPQRVRCRHRVYYRMSACRPARRPESDPNGVRSRVTDVKGRFPRPLGDGAGEGKSNRPEGWHAIGRSRHSPCTVPRPRVTRLLENRPKLRGIRSATTRDGGAGQRATTSIIVIIPASACSRMWQCIIQSPSSTGQKSYRLSDSPGLYLEVSPGGGKWWRFQQHAAGREKRLALGTDPDVPPRSARGTPTSSTTSCSGEPRRSSCSFAVATCASRNWLDGFSNSSMPSSPGWRMVTSWRSPPCGRCHRQHRSPARVKAASLTRPDPDSWADGVGP